MTRVGESNGEAVQFEALTTYLDQTAVDFAILFGSHARGETDDGSDVDIALRFPPELSSHERFSLRNRIDADLQEYADCFVDVSDLEALPTPVAYAAVRDGSVLVGDSETVESYREQIAQAYAESADERETQRDEFISRLARGDV